MNYDNLYILISTIDNRIKNLSNMLLSEQANIFYIISHQIINSLDTETKEVIYKIKERKDITYLVMNNIKGVSKNRNNLLDQVSDGIALISDDDTIFCSDAFEKIRQAFIDNFESDVITFKTLNLSEKEYRMYPKERVVHNQRSITGIGTIEVAFRVNNIQRKNIRFDENFGPGALQYPVGEDYIFMADVLKKRLKAIFVPIAIVKHPDMNTGLRFDDDVLYGRGAVFARVFGFKSVIIDVVYSFRKYKLYKHEVDFFTYLYLMLKGSIHYLMHGREKSL